MAVHNAIVKKAQKFGIIMEDLGNEEDRNERFKAIWPEYNQVLFGPEAKYLLDDMIAVRKMRKEFQSFECKIQDDNTVVVKVRGTNIEVVGLRANAAFDVAFKAWQEARSELDIEDEDEDNETEAEIDAAHEIDEEERVGSVVSEKYRARYAEAGHPNTCGDWLADVLDGICKNKEGFNLELFAVICNANDIDMSKYKTEKASDRGRYRMTGRNKLSRIVWLTGELKMPDTINGGESYRAPQEWRAEVQAKYKYKKPAEPAPKTPVKEA
jgi:hypothetical protein